MLDRSIPTSQRYPVSVALFFMALLLAGLKAPCLFAGWSIICLGYGLFAYHARPWLPEKSITTPLAYYFVIVILVFALSSDHTESLFWSTQWMFYGFLWLFLNREFRTAFSPADWRWGFMLSGWVAGLQTIRQLIEGQVAYGWLPLNPNFNALWLAGLCIFFVADCLRFQPTSTLVKYAEPATALFLGLVVLIGPSRGALVALVAGMVYLVAVERSRKCLAILAGLALLAALGIIHGWTTVRFKLTYGDPLRADRLHIWWIALQAIGQHPFAGYGMGNFELAYRQFAFPVNEDLVRYARSTRFAHNDYLQIAAELGLPFAAVLFSGLGWVLSRPVRLDCPLDRPAQAALLTMATGAIFNPVIAMPFLAIFIVILAAMVMQGRQAAAGKSPVFSVELRGKRVSGTIHKASFALTMICLFWIGIRSVWSSRADWHWIVAFNPTDAQAWHELGFSNTDPLSSVKYARNAARWGPNQLYYHEAYATALEISGDPKNMAAALKELLRAIQLSPSRAVDYLAVGRLLFRSTKPSLALPWFERARKIEPNYWQADLWIARCYVQMGQKEKALFILENLPIRRRAVLQRFTGPYVTLTDYEKEILGYSSQVLGQEIAKVQPDYWKVSSNRVKF